MRPDDKPAIGAKARTPIAQRLLYAPYLETAWGFKNAWYPALFSAVVADNEVKGVTLVGHDIALRRVKGRVHAVQDRCAHRGVKLSLRPTCLTDDTITCW